MKDIYQDKFSSADVDERHPANRNKWDCFDLNLTCYSKAFLSFAFNISSFSLPSVPLVDEARQLTAPNKTDKEIKKLFLERRWLKTSVVHLKHKLSI